MARKYHVVREVDERASDRRDQDAAAGRDVAGVEPPAGVDDDARDRPVPARDEDLGLVGPEAPLVDDRRHRRKTAQRCSFATREDGREPPTVAREPGVAVRVDAGMNQMERAACAPPTHRAAIQARRAEIRNAQRPVLTGCESRWTGLGRGGCVTTSSWREAGVTHPRIVGRAGVTDLHPDVTKA